VNVQQDGTLSVDTGTLTSALSGNFSAVQSFFQSATNGFATNFSNDLTTLTDPTKGALYIDLQGISQDQAAVTQQISDFQANVAQQQQTWTQQFSQVNATLQTLPLLLDGESRTNLPATLGTRHKPGWSSHASLRPDR